MLLNHVWKNLGSYLRTAVCQHSLVIDLFRLFILFSHFRPRMVPQRTVSVFQMSSNTRASPCICMIIIHCFHIGYNAPCLPPVPPPSNSNSSWVLQSSQEKSKTMVTQNLEGGRGKHGELWSNCIVYCNVMLNYVK